MAPNSCAIFAAAKADCRTTRVKPDDEQHPAGFNTKLAFITDGFIIFGTDARKQHT